MTINKKAISGRAENRLQDIVEELQRSNNLFTRLVTNSESATVLLDTDLRIRHFTQPSEKPLKLIATDVSRPLNDCLRNFRDDTLPADCQRVLDQLLPVARNVVTDAGQCYLRRVLPYRISDNPIDGVVVTWVDITERKRAEQEVRKLNEKLEQRVLERTEALRRTEHEYHTLADNVPALFAYVDSEQRYRFVNKRYQEYFAAPPTEIVDRSVRDVLGEQAYEFIRGHVEAALSGQEVRFEAELQLSQVGMRWMRGVYVPDRDNQGIVNGLFALVADVTESKRAEQALRESERRFRTIFEQAGVGVALVETSTGRFVRINQKYCDMVGFSTEEMTQKTFQEITHPDDLQPDLDNMRKLIEGNLRGFTMDKRYCRKDGSLVWVTLTVSPTWEPWDEPRYHIAIVEDITERKQAEQALRIRDRAIATAAAPIVICDIDGRLTYVNRAFVRLWGYDFPEDVIGRPNVDFSSSLEDVGAVMEGVRTDGHWEGERLAKKKDGSLFEIQVSASLVQNSDGTPLCVIASLMDISERKRVENALRESEAKICAIVNTAADAIITIGDDGTINAVNPATEQMFGYTADELLGGNIKLLMPSPFRDEHDNYVAKYVKTGLKRVIGIGRELNARRKDGSVFPVSLTVSEHQYGTEWLFTGIVRDMSERRRLQKEVLEIAVAEQRRIGQDLHDGVGQELTGLGLLAHGLVESLEQNSLPEAKSAARIADGLENTLKQVRALSKGLVPVEVDAHGLMSALEELADDSRGFGRMGCVFECPDPVSVADNTTATHLYHIAQEAVTNALKHSQANNVSISLQSDALRIMLKVADDGVGIGEDQPGHEAGTGLRIMPYRAGLIGGTLSIRPRANGGTVVTCILGEP